MSKQRRSNRIYDLEFKKQAVKLLTDEGLTLKKVSDDLGVPCSTLFGWLQNIDPNEAEIIESASSIVRQGKGLSNQSLKTKLDQQQKIIKQLQADLKRTTMEREILKKATAYFASLQK